jgi:hypothetical protein
METPGTGDNIRPLTAGAQGDADNVVQMWHSGRMWGRTLRRTVEFGDERSNRGPALDFVRPGVQPSRQSMGAISSWTAYALAWAVAAIVWTFAAAAGAAVSPIETLPWGLLTMTIAASMGVAVWWLTGRIPPDRPRSFVAVHTASLLAYAVIYATWFVWPDLVRGEVAAAAGAIRRSPIVIWNLLMGSWLYLVVAGVSYALRAHRRAAAEASAASEARLLAQQAHFAALTAQLNPHFLFNALHSVGSLVSSDPEAADEALARLGDLLRYALADEDEVPLWSEWAFTKDYLAFEQLRLGERLRTDVHVDPSALEVLVPALVLQPLVENAVRHGIAPRPEGGMVSVDAHLADDKLVMRVADEGNSSTRIPVRTPTTGSNGRARSAAFVNGQQPWALISSTARPARFYLPALLSGRRKFLGSARGDDRCYR